MADTIKNYKAGEIICKEGSYEMWMYELLSGTASVYVDYEEPTKKKVAEISSGFIGEMGLISERPRAATVVADTDVSVAIISEEDYIEYFKEHQEKIGAIVGCLSERLKKSNEDYTNACQTICEYLAANEENKPKSNALVDAVKKLIHAAHKE